MSQQHDVELGQWRTSALPRWLFVLGTAVGATLACSRSSRAEDPSVPPPWQLDLAWEQFHTDLAAELEVSRLAMDTGADGVRLSLQHVSMARLLRLRGEYADAEAQLELAVAEEEAEQVVFGYGPLISTFIWFESAMILRDRIQGLESAPNILSPAKIAYASEYGTKIGLGLFDLQLDAWLAHDFPMSALDEAALGSMAHPELRQWAWEVGMATSAYELFVSLDGHPSPADSSPVLDIDTFLTQWSRPFDSAPRADPLNYLLDDDARTNFIEWMPELDGRSRTCGAAPEPYAALYCAEELLFDGDSSTVGLKSQTKLLLGQRPQLALAQARGVELLDFAEAGFKKMQGAKRGLARVTQIRAGLAFKQLALGERDDLADVEKMLADAAALANEVGDLRMFRQLRSLQILHLALAHDRERVHAETLSLAQELAQHQDLGMAATFVAMSEYVSLTQVNRRADLVAAELLSEVGFEMGHRVGGGATNLHTSILTASTLIANGAGDQAAPLLEDIEARLQRLRSTQSQWSVLLDSIETELLLTKFSLSTVRHNVEQQQLVVDQMGQLLHEYGGVDKSMPQLWKELQDETERIEQDNRGFGQQLEEMQSLMVIPEDATTSGEVAPYFATFLRELSQRLLEESQQRQTALERWGRADFALRLMREHQYARIALIVAKEEQAILNDPDRSPNLLYQRLEHEHATLRMVRPDILAAILESTDRHSEAIAALMAEPQMAALGPDLQVDIGGTLVNFSSRDDRLLGLRMTQLLRMGAYDEAMALGEQILDVTDLFGRSSYFEFMEQLLRHKLAVDGPEEAWSIAGTIREQMDHIDQSLDPRLRSGAFASPDVVGAIAVVVDVALARGDAPSAARLIARAQPNLFAQIGERGNPRLANLIAFNRIKLSDRQLGSCDQACRVEIDTSLTRNINEIDSLSAGRILQPYGADLDSIELSPESALLTYLVSDDAVHVLLVRPGKPPSVTSRSVEYLRLRGRVQRLSSQLGRGLAEPFFERDLEVIADILLPPAEQLSDVSRLIIIPSDIIADVPFALLPFADGPLIETFDLVETPALAFLESHRKPTNSNHTGRKLNSRVLVSAADNRLLFSTVEARMLAKLTHAEVEHAARIEDFDAAIRSQAYQVVHVIAHGRAAADDRPASLLLTEGALDASDILLAEDDSPVPLVVFSACEIGVAQGSLTDDGFRIGASLLRRGVEEVVVPLWRIEESKATVDFWKLFYRALRKHGSASQALASAQRSARSRKIPASVWAAYKVTSRVP